MTSPEHKILTQIADIAHDGGLGNLSEAAALVAIRRLTLKYWDAGRSITQATLCVNAAEQASRAAMRPIPRCACCGTTENLRQDLGSGGPYRCTSPDCLVF